MKILHGGRASGKTAYAILESARTGYPILASSERAADELYRRAKQIGVDIPYPVYYTGTRQKVNTPLIVDNFERIFEDYVQREFGTRVVFGTVGSPIQFAGFRRPDEEAESVVEHLRSFNRAEFEAHYLGKWGGVEPGGEV